jgi:acetyl esterase/lipase
VPIGYLVTTALAALVTIFALAPPRPRHSSPTNRSYWLGFLVNELPFVLFYVLLASTLLAIGQRDLATPLGWVGFGLAVLTTVGLVIVVRRALQTRPVIDRALSEGLGAGWRSAIDPELAARLRRRLPFARILFAPFFHRGGDVERIANISYGNAGKWNLLDVYRHRSHPSRGPTLVYFHGGAFRSGRKSREALPLIYRLASQGWVCINANYRLSPSARFPDHLIDVKKVIAWVREHGHEYGADPAVVFVAGSSAGGHLGSMAALTPNDPAFQPGFEDADTSVTAAVSLYGFYGSPGTDRPRPSSPMAYVTADAPPFFVSHGDKDTVVVVEDARRFAEQLRNTSANPVVYAELTGAQHTFDLFHSIRFETVVDGIEAFAAWVRSRASG